LATTINSSETEGIHEMFHPEAIAIAHRQLGLYVQASL